MIKLKSAEGGIMGKYLYRKYIESFDLNLLDCKFLGRGHNGIVYLLPEGKVIKICYEDKSCKKEYDILKRIKKNKFFPRVYGMSGNYMIRDYVEGERLDNYIKKHGLSEELALKIVDLLEEFEKLQFTKMDLRCKDIFINSKGNLKVIDPKKFYTKKRNFPKHLEKGLKNLNVLEFFMATVRKNKNKLYRKWISENEKFLTRKKKDHI